MAVVSGALPQISTDVEHGAVVVARVMVVHSPARATGSPGAGRPRLPALSLLDFYVLRYFARGYVVCFASLLALYVIVDFFTKTDEFAANTRGLVEFVRHAGGYYLMRLPWFFLRLNGAMALLAAVFTLAWLERQNEVVAWLAAGVPARRLLAPVLCAAAATLALAVANREFVVPRCSAALQRNADDPRGDKLRMVQGTYDADRILIEGGAADPTRGAIEGARVTFPPDSTGGLVHLQCVVMVHRPARGDDDNGWYLYDVEGLPNGFAHARLDYVGPGVYFLHTDVTFERLQRPPAWFHYEPTTALVNYLDEDGGGQRRVELIMALHRRLTAPLLDFLLILLAVTLLRVGQSGHGLYLKFGACLLLYAASQAIQFVCQGLSQNEVIGPMLAAWAPVFVFGPIAFACLDELRQ